MAKTFKSYRKASLADWGDTLEEGEALNRDQIKTGALLRIADATEAMAVNHNNLIADLKWHKNRLETELLANVNLLNRVRALRGHLTRLKRKEHSI